MVITLNNTAQLINSNGETSFIISQDNVNSFQIHLTDGNTASTDADDWSNVYFDRDGVASFAGVSKNFYVRQNDESGRLKVQLNS